MAQREMLDLQTNRPLTVEVKYADWRQTRYGDKLKLAVVVPEGLEHYPAGEYDLFLAAGQEAEVIALGIVAETAPKDGKRQFRVAKGSRLHIERTEHKGEDGKKIAVTKLRGVNPDGSLLTPPAPGAAPTPGPAAPHAAGAAPVVAPRFTGGLGEPADDAAKRHALVRWLALGDAYKVAAELAADALGHALGLPAEKLDHQAVVNLTCSFLLRAENEKVGTFRGLEKHVAQMRKGAAVPTRAPAAAGVGGRAQDELWREREAPADPAGPDEDDLPF